MGKSRIHVRDFAHVKKFSKKILRKETRMKTFGLKKLIPVGIGLLTLSAFVGSISGSIAWWAYSTRVSISYQGTSVSTSEQLQIGLKLDATAANCDDIVTELATLGIEEDDTLASATTRYVFSKAGGGLPAEAIRTYLQAQNVYSYNELTPVTSKSYAAGQALTLYETMIYQRQDTTEIALRKKYVYIPFVFRILKLNAVSHEDKYAEGREIFLSKSLLEMHSDNPDSNIGHGLRIHFNNGGTSATDRFIFNPLSTATGTNMKTPVCGLLDLNNDKVYDCYDNNHPTKAGQEIIYGQFTGEPTNVVDQVADATELSNINEMELPVDFDYTDIQNNRNTFLAAHMIGEDRLVDYTGITKSYAEFKTLETIKPDDTQAKLTGGQALTVTAGESGNYLAELNTTIWLEGWDHAVIDNAVSHKFNLGLVFQIDLVS